MMFLKASPLVRVYIYCIKPSKVRYNISHDSLPKEKQELARSLRNDYFAKNLPVNSSVATQLKEKMEGLNDADKFELMKSPAGKSALNAAMKEMSNVDRAELNRGLANLLYVLFTVEIKNYLY